MKWLAFRMSLSSCVEGRAPRPIGPVLTGLLLIILVVALVCFLTACAIYKKSVQYKDSRIQGVEGSSVQVFKVTKTWYGTSWQTITDKDQLSSPPLARSWQSEFKSERQEGPTEPNILDHIKGIISAVLGFVFS